MNTFTKYSTLLVLSLSIIPLGIISLFYLFSLSYIGIILTPMFLIPIWLLCFNKMDKAEINDHDMEIKKEMDDDLKRLGISQHSFSEVKEQ